MCPLRAAGAVLTTLLLGRAAVAGVVRGQVAIPGDRADAPSEGLWRIDNGILPVTPKVIDPRSECLVVLVPRAAHAAKEASKDETVTVELRGLRLQSAVIAVPLGATLEIKNEDRVPHTMYTAAPDETILPMRPTPAGATRSERMQRPGTFQLLDDEMPHVRGWLVITDGGIAVRLDERGAFRAEVPDGRYGLRLFHRGTFVLERDVDVGPKPVDLQLTLPPRTPPRHEAPAEPVRPAAPPPAADGARDGGPR